MILLCDTARAGVEDLVLQEDPYRRSYVADRRIKPIFDTARLRDTYPVQILPKRIVIVGYSGVNGFDIVGPSEVFASARSPSGEAAYEIEVLAPGGDAFTTEAGLHIVPHRRLGAASGADTIIIPGGEGLRRPENQVPIANWLKQASRTARRVAAVCTGSYGLAAAGLLNGRKATTHWRFANDFAHRYPEIDLDPNLIFVKDGSFYTSGGISAGIDLALALVEEDFGPKAALAVAREMVVFLKRSGGQHQYSEPLRFQAGAGDRFADLLAWISGALSTDLSVKRLATIACLSPRQFTRAFQRAVGLTPAAYVEQLRMDRAADLLSSTTISIDRAAAQVGYGSADVFRRAFERRFGVNPGVYRRRFSTTAST